MAGAAALVAALVVAATPGSRATASTTVPVGTTVAIPHGTARLGALPASTPIDVDVVLQPRNAAALTALATDVSTPGSPEYHQYLAPGQFAGEFGATPSAIAQVEAALRAEGLHPAGVNSTGLSISVTATAAELSRAFSTSFASYRLADGRNFYANTAAPSVPSSVAPFIQAVIGLDNEAKPQPLAVRHPAAASTGARTKQSINADAVGPQPCSGAVADPAYTADQFASVYDMAALYSRGDEGAGQTIAIFEDGESNLPSDIAAYQACYGTHVPVSYISVDGGVPLSPGEGEAALDIETIIGLAPQAKILVYQNSGNGSFTHSAYDTFSAIIGQDLGKIVSVSYGDCEAHDASGLSAENVLFQQAAVQGQSIMVASGDSGSEACYQTDNTNGSYSVSDPASQPFVTAVGGTDLFASGTTNGQVSPQESPWNDAYLNGPGNGGAGGGGISSHWAMPSYQSAYGSSDGTFNSYTSGTPCGNTQGYCREVPDVAADGSDADSYAVYYDGQWIGVGGTSAATPLWAAVIALANAACPAEPPVGFANPTLYWAASPAFPETAMWDVGTQGAGLPTDNDFLNPGSGFYSSLPGYDEATGLGSPDAVNLAAALCGNGLFRSEPGAASDIAVGANGSTWVIGSPPAANGHAIYHWTGLGWALVPGGGVTIAVAPNGDPWIINSSNQIYAWNGRGWVLYPGSATDISIGANGSVWVVGTSTAPGGHGIYHWTGTGWAAYPGGGVRVAVGPNGYPWLVNSSNQIYAWNGRGWVLYPGSATDISIGANGSVWVVGTSTVPGGHGIYHWTGTGWALEPGGAVRIAVGPQGNPWIVNSSGQIYQG